VEQTISGTQLGDLQRRVEILEDSNMRQEESIRQLFAQDEGMKAHLTQILTRFDAMETKIFSYLMSISASSEKERNAERKERKNVRQEFMVFAKYVLVSTLGAVLAYWMARMQ
jgi:hypothetical protein